MLYLDTHVVIWLFQNDRHRFSDPSIQFINEHKRSLFISPLVLLEIEYLFEIERVRHTSAEMVDYLGKRIDLTVCRHPFNEIIATALEQKWTRDPFDRIITSHAMVKRSLLLTKDETIRQHYPSAVW